MVVQTIKKLHPPKGPDGNVSKLKLDWIEALVWNACRDCYLANNWEKFNLKTKVAEHLNLDWALSENCMNVADYNMRYRMQDKHHPLQCITGHTALLGYAYNEYSNVSGMVAYIRPLRVYGSVMMFLQIKVHGKKFSTEQQQYFFMGIQLPMNSLLFDVL